MLTQERLKELLDYDPETGVFTWKQKPNRNIVVGAPAGHKCSQGYIKIKIKGKEHRAHRLVWLYMYGKWPDKDIDHINRVRDDNRLNNLREAHKHENMWNRNKHTNNTSGYTGVSWNKQKGIWYASIQVFGKNKHVGAFDTPEAAHAAYMAAKEKHHNI